MNESQSELAAIAELSARYNIEDSDTFEPGKVGAWTGIPMDVYQWADGESNSLLALLACSPLRYRMTRDRLLNKPEPTNDMVLGTMIHSGVNEGIEPVYHLQPDTYLGKEGTKKDAPMIDKPWNMNSNTCKAWVAAHQDLPILDRHEALMLNSVVNAVLLDPRAKKLLAGAWREVSACARNDDQAAPYLLRARFDILGRDDAGWFFVELKSTRDASTESFSREILKRAYHCQCALYRRVLRRLTDSEPRCFVIACEKDASIARVNVRQLMPSAMDLGDKILDERLALLAKCRLANSWPALADEEGGENIPFISLPDYAMGGSVDDLAGLTEIDGDEEKEK